MNIEIILKNLLDNKKRLTLFPAKRKNKIYALYYLACKLEPHKLYTEEELNDLLCSYHTFHDPATLRREMYNYKFINRERDCAHYWLEEKMPDLPELSIITNE